MEVKGIESAITAPKEVTEKQQETVKRVQKEFLRQILNGVSEEEAFKN